jgi:hypothetical protein
VLSFFLALVLALAESGQHSIDDADPAGAPHFRADRRLVFSSGAPGGTLGGAARRRVRNAGVLYRVNLAPRSSGRGRSSAAACSSQS